MIEWARNGGSQQTLRGNQGMKTSMLAFSTMCDANAMNSDKIRFLWLLDAKKRREGVSELR